MKMNSFETEPKTIEELESEILELKSENQDLKLRLEVAEKEAINDPLTGIYNRRGFEKLAGHILPEAKPSNLAEQRDIESESHKYVGILHLDIDSFKEINDTYGHAEGDRILQEAARYLKSAMRENDVVARQGGDEFIVLLNGATGRIINKFFDRDAEPARPRFGFETEINGKKARISFSGGIALARDGETINDLDTIINRADLGLYESKQAGHDRITLVSERTHPGS